MKEITITSFGEYVEYVEKYKGRYLFRGHSNARWSIMPSLFRNTTTLDLDKEFLSVSEKMSSNSNLSPITALFDLQHYGTPTRICDLTISPLGALFFASENEEDGAVFVIDKSKTISADNYAIGLMSLILEKGISTFLELQKESDGLYDVFEIITKNYIVEYKDLAYTNPRAFRQGGTGIIFGFGKCGNVITSKGNSTADEFIFEKIIVPYSVKNEARRYLYRLGYSNEMLYDVLVGTDDVALTETKFECQQRFDKTPFYKIRAEYQVDSLYFDRDKLALKIEAIYNALFRKYGPNARNCSFYISCT